jgi:hypothetical protein
VATYFAVGISAKVRCTYVQPGQGRIPRAPGRLSHSCRIVHAQSLGVRVHRTRDDRCSCKRDAGSPLRSSPVHVGRLRLHSACINPRDRPREAPPSAMPNAARRRAPRARTAAQGRDGESREKDRTRPTKKRREDGGGRNAGSRSERRVRRDYLQGMPLDQATRTMSAKWVLIHPIGHIDRITLYLTRPTSSGFLNKYLLDLTIVRRHRERERSLISENLAFTNFLLPHD